MKNYVFKIEYYILYESKKRNYNNLKKIKKFFCI